MKYKLFVCSICKEKVLPYFKVLV